MRVANLRLFCDNCKEETPHRLDKEVELVHTNSIIKTYLCLQCGYPRSVEYKRRKK